MKKGIYQISFGQIESVEFLPVNISFDEWHIESIANTIGNRFFIKDMLKNEQLHVAPVDAFEYIMSDCYALLDSISVSYSGASGSISLFSSKQIDELEPSVIAVPRGYEYEVALLKILLYQNNVDLNAVIFKEYKPQENIENFLCEYDAVLSCEKIFLGKPIINAPYMYDLAQEWKRLNNLPFVHFLWVTHNDWKLFNENIFEQLKILLAKAVDIGLGVNFNKTINTLSKKYDKQLSLVENYYKNNVSYEFNQSTVESLKLFADMYNALQ